MAVVLSPVEVEVWVYMFRRLATELPGSKHSAQVPVEPVQVLPAVVKDIQDKHTAMASASLSVLVSCSCYRCITTLTCCCGGA